VPAAVRGMHESIILLCRETISSVSAGAFHFGLLISSRFGLFVQNWGFWLKNFSGMLTGNHG